MRPISQLFVLSSFVLGKHIIIQSCHAVSDCFIVTTSNILNRLSHQIADLEGNNLIGPVLNHGVVDLRSNLFPSVQNRLISLIVSIEIINLGPVLKMNGKCLLQNTHNISIRDFLYIGINHSTTAQRLHSAKTPPLYLLHHCSLYRILQCLSMPNLSEYHWRE